MALDAASSKSSLDFYNLDTTRIRNTIRVFLLVDIISQIYGLYLIVFVPEDKDHSMVMFASLVVHLLFVVSIAPTNVDSLKGLEVSRKFLSFRFVVAFEAIVLALRLKFSKAATAWLVFHWFYLSFTIGVLLATLKKYQTQESPKLHRIRRRVSLA